MFNDSVAIMSIEHSIIEDSHLETKIAPVGRNALKMRGLL